MKILHVINSLATGGAERFLVDLCPRLRSRGLDCRVLALTGRNDQFSAGLRDAGVPVGFLAPISSPYDPGHVVALRKVFREERPDIVHAHLFPAQYWCAFAAAGLRGVRLVTTEHSSRNRRMDKTVLVPLERFVYRKYDRIIAISGGVGDQLRRHLGNGERIVQIPNGIDVGRFRLSGIRERTPGGSIRVGMSARFVPAKDHATILKALALLPDRFEAMFAGDGETRRDAERLAKDLGLAGRVEFRGNQPDVRTFLEPLDVYVQSSRWEGFGIAALEAMASGLPVAASDVPGLREVIGDSGALFPSGDSAALAKILAGWEDSDVRSTVGRRCADRASLFSIEKTAEEYQSLYREVEKRRLSCPK